MGFLRAAPEHARLFLGVPHLGVHVEPFLQCLEISPVGLGEANAIVLFDHVEVHRPISST